MSNRFRQLPVKRTMFDFMMPVTVRVRLMPGVVVRCLTVAETGVLMASRFQRGKRQFLNPNTPGLVAGGSVVLLGAVE